MAGLGRNRKQRGTIHGPPLRKLGRKTATRQTGRIGRYPAAAGRGRSTGSKARQAQAASRQKAKRRSNPEQPGPSKSATFWFPVREHNTCIIDGETANMMAQIAALVQPGVMLNIVEPSDTVILSALAGPQDIAKSHSAHVVEWWHTCQDFGQCCS